LRLIKNDLIVLFWLSEIFWLLALAILTKSSTSSSVTLISSFFAIAPRTISSLIALLASSEYSLLNSFAVFLIEAK